MLLPSTRISINLNLNQPPRVMLTYSSLIFQICVTSLCHTLLSDPTPNKKGA
jgi:hypothetical protein